MNSETAIAAYGARARAASLVLAAATAAEKSSALEAMASAVDSGREMLLEQNALDMDQAAGFPADEQNDSAARKEQAECHDPFLPRYRVRFHRGGDVILGSHGRVSTTAA